MLFFIKINDEGFIVLILYIMFRKFNYKRYDCSEFNSFILIVNFYRYVCNCNYFLLFCECLVR